MPFAASDMGAGPLVLGFDTSAAHLAAALVSGARVVLQREVAMEKGQAEALMPFLQALLGEAAVEWRDLNRIGVGVGPGNFTGIRISVAAARGLALALGVPAVGVSRLEAQVLGMPRPCTSIVPATRAQVYRQDFPDGTPALVDLNEVPPQFVGPGGVTPAHPLAVAIALIAAEARGDALSLRPTPMYIRPPDAAPRPAGLSLS